ncbi:hypothetical protein MUGA111182_14455 [Mucilaginibacter galii]|uniref:Uncharacterized protein n=2 Tax=Mucilaginibacter galii TaxID=2005073 RepID=A0A917J6H0_9SPHI|nr:hypothetical protein GCM10011425_07810 [Mucilaginibacter galii]
MCAGVTFAQSGTYQKIDKNGSSCTIAVIKTGNKLEAAAFAWWGTTSGTNGNFSGAGTLTGQVCTVKSADDAGCGLTITLINIKIRAIFNDCMTSNLPEDFSGTYALLTTALPGVYKVKGDHSYFYKSASLRNKLKTYLVKGDKVIITLENIHNKEWVYINYRNLAGNETSGYMRLSALKLIKPSLN